MEVFEAVKTVLAVRKYESRPVPEESIRRILEAGRLTASGSNQQPWHFIVVEEPEKLRKLAEYVRTGPYIVQAPLAIVVIIERTKLAVSDGSRAIQSMILTAWSEGIGSNWVGFQGIEGVKGLLGIPGEMEVLAILPFGYPAQPAGKGKKNRKPLEEVASRGRYGTQL